MQFSTLFTLLPFLLQKVVCPGHGSATACANSNGDVLGEVACSAAPGKIAITETDALLECSKEAAGEFIEACTKKFGDSVEQVGKRITGSQVQFAPYTVVDGSKRTRLSSKTTLEAFKKPPPPPPKPRNVDNQATKSSLSLLGLAISVFTCCAVLQ